MLGAWLWLFLLYCVSPAPQILTISHFTWSLVTRDHNELTDLPTLICHNICNDTALSIAYSWPIEFVGFTVISSDDSNTRWQYLPVVPTASPHGPLCLTGLWLWDICIKITGSPPTPGSVIILACAAWSLTQPALTRNCHFQEEQGFSYLIIISFCLKDCFIIERFGDWCQYPTLRNIRFISNMGCYCQGCFQ